MSEQSPFSSNIENLLGLTVEIVLNNNKKIKGNIFTLNPKSKLIILVNKQKDNENFNVSIINIIEIKKIELAKNQLDLNIEELCQNDLNHIKEKEKRNLEKDNILKRAETEPNFKKGLEIYKTLSKFYNCSYDGTKIIIGDNNCYIEEPFRLKNLHCKDDNKREKIEIVAFGINNNYKKK